MKTERTLILIKPESIQRHLIGEFIKRFENRGLKLVGCKLVLGSAQLLGEHYAKTNNWEATGQKALTGYELAGHKLDKSALELGLEVRDKLMQAFAGRPVLAMVWQGPHAVALGRKTVGSTNPLDADVGTIRGDYSVDSYFLSDKVGRPVQNLVHASSDIEEAKREIQVWFRADELVDYPLVCDEVLYGDEWGRG